MANAEPEFHNGFLILTKVEEPDQIRNWCNESSRLGKKKPLLSPNIRVVFPLDNVEHTGVYLDHGDWKTVFEMKYRHRTYTYLDGDVLKVARNNDGDVLKVTREKDIEPTIFRHLRENCLECDILSPRIIYEGTGYDKKESFHCWITERCIPMHQVLTCDKINKEKAVLGVCRCMAKAAAKGVRISDCFFYNFGVLVTGNEREHKVVILDAGCREILKREIPKKELNAYMKKLWDWASQAGVPHHHAW